MERVSWTAPSEEGSPTASTGFVYTFYSYKGGTGRSMSLANVGYLLARKGFKVLLIDWDLEAPGLEKYLAHLQPRVLEDRKTKPGVVDLIEDWLPARAEWRTRYDAWHVLDTSHREKLERFRTLQLEIAHARAAGSAGKPNEHLLEECARVEAELRALDDHIDERYPNGTPEAVLPDWRAALIDTTSLASGGQLHFMSAGRDDETYAKRVNGLRWDKLFAEQELGWMLERFREELKKHYHFILVDSRTGISDIEGICTVLLPDALVLLFTTMRQSIQGVMDVWKHACEQRARLPVPRGQLRALPLPSRDEIDRENKLASEWHEIYATHFEPAFRQWLPDEVRALDAVKQLALPYVAAWSFGESLPVVQNEADLSNPRSINAAYDRVAGLLAARLSWDKAAAAQSTKIGLLRGEASLEIRPDIAAASPAPTAAPDSTVLAPPIPGTATRTHVWAWALSALIALGALQFWLASQIFEANGRAERATEATSNARKELSSLQQDYAQAKEALGKAEAELKACVEKNETLMVPQRPVEELLRENEKRTAEVIEANLRWSQCRKDGDWTKQKLQAEVDRLGREVVRKQAEIGRLRGAK